MVQQNGVKFKDKDKTNKDGTIECCDSPKISQEDGFNVCMNCGYIHSRIFDNSPRRAFTKEEILKRKTNEKVYSPIGPRTVIQGKRDGRGSLLNAKYQSKFNRLSKIHRSLTTSYERNLWIALPNLHRLQKKLGISDPIAEDALRIYTQTVKKKLTMGRSIDGLLSASIYCAIRIHALPRTIEEVEEASQVERKKMLKNYRLICTKIIPNMQGFKVKRITPEIYVDKFRNELNLSMNCRNKAIKLLNRTKKKGGMVFSGKDPKGFAAAVLYIASKICNEAKTQKEVAEVSNITEVTLRTRVKEIKKLI
jgi:transcription initiation factor TFIIB